jgi:hypothetical protein
VHSPRLIKPLFPIQTAILLLATRHSSKSGAVQPIASTLSHLRQTDSDTNNF